MWAHCLGSHLGVSLPLRSRVSCKPKVQSSIVNGVAPNSGAGSSYPTATHLIGRLFHVASAHRTTRSPCASFHRCASLPNSHHHPQQQPPSIAACRSSASAFTSTSSSPQQRVCSSPTAVAGAQGGVQPSPSAGWSRGVFRARGTFAYLWSWWLPLGPPRHMPECPALGHRGTSFGMWVGKQCV